MKKKGIPPRIGTSLRRPSIQSDGKGILARLNNEKIEVKAEDQRQKFSESQGNFFDLKNPKYIESIQQKSKKRLSHKLQKEVVQQTLELARRQSLAPKPSQFHQASKQASPENQKRPKNLQRQICQNSISSVSSSQQSSSEV